MKKYDFHGNELADGDTVITYYKAWKQKKCLKRGVVSICPKNKQVLVKFIPDSLGEWRQPENVIREM